MIKIGLDFDNTLINYDKVFYRIAYQNKLVPKEIDQNKNSVREYLIKENKEHIFTSLQGEVYGSRILEAPQSEGMFETLNVLKNKGARLIIVSHKTKYPYKGKKYDLHHAAKSWLEKNKLLDYNYLAINKEDVYFETTKESKVQRIHQLKLDFFIDDLQSILELINSDINRILYNPNNLKLKLTNISQIQSWHQLLNIIDI